MLAAISRVITHPSLAGFDAERANADLARAITATVSVGVVTGVIGGFVNMFLANGPAADIVVLATMTPRRLIAALLAAQAFLFVAARLLGGDGKFIEQVYLSALVFAPLNALASLVGVWPGVGAFIAFAVLLHGVFLTSLALRAAHGAGVGNPALWILSLMGGILGWVVISALPS